MSDELEQEPLVDVPEPPTDPDEIKKPPPPPPPVEPGEPNT